MLESMQTFAMALVAEPMNAAITMNSSWPNRAARRAPTKVAAVDQTMIRVGCFNSMRVPTPLPSALPTPAAAPTAPSSRSCAQPELSSVCCAFA